MNYKLLIALWLVPTTVFSQKTMSIEDAVLGRFTYLRPETPVALQWKSEDAYVLTNKDTLWENTVKKDQPKAILSLRELDRAGRSLMVNFTRFPDFTFIRNGLMKIQHQRNFMLFDPVEKSFTMSLPIPSEAEHTDFCDNNSTLAYTKGNNLFIADKNGEKQITFETDLGIVCGQEVHRREFGIEKGTFWSMTGKYIAFYRKDERMVSDYPLVDYMTRVAEYNPVKYPMAGMASHEVTVGIYNLETGKTIFLDTGLPKDHYLTNISWGPDDKSIYIAELNREQNHMQLNRYGVETGKKIKTLFEETASTYVEPQHPIVFSPTNPEQFYYMSRKDGWWHLYLYSTDGKLVKQVTKGNWEVTDFYGADAQEKNIFIQSTMESPIERHIYKVNLANGSISKLSREAGTNQALFSPAKKTFIEQREEFDVPSKTVLRKADGEYIRQIRNAKFTLGDYELGGNHIVKIKAADNTTDLYGRIILPNGFDPSQKYPVIVYVYGGPHSQMVANKWLNGVDWWHYYMAAQGYVVFTLDNRGTSNRGQAFEDVIHRQLGIAETSDQMKGLEYLKSLGYVDPERIGVFGWSYGGFMTLNLMLGRPGVFKVAVAGGPVVDWELYEIMYGERYMDLPGENPEGYEKTDMSKYAGSLEGKLMLIHGVQDETVVMQHSMKFIRECVKKNKQVDFFAYPTHPHNVRGKDRVHLMTKISQYFFDYL